MDHCGSTTKRYHQYGAGSQTSTQLREKSSPRHASSLFQSAIVKVLTSHPRLFLVSFLRDLSLYLLDYEAPSRFCRHTQSLARVSFPPQLRACGF